MKLLLTSAGIKNPSLRAAMVDLLGKPIAESNALAIPTAGYGHPNGRPERAYSFITGFESETPMVELGWKSVGILEVTALPSINRDRWVGWVENADILLANGGDALYLAYWMRESGLDKTVAGYPDKVWVGLSGGSMAVTPRIGSDFVGWQQPDGTDSALGIVDFAIFPHLDNPGLPDNNMTTAAGWAVEIGIPGYVMDDQTGIKVVDGNVEVVSEGHWTLFNA